MYAVKDPETYQKLNNSDLPVPEKHVKMLQHRHAALPLGYYINPFNPHQAQQGEAVVATFRTAEEAAIFVLFMQWWSVIYKDYDAKD